jgi:hypothetical protein
MNNRYKNANKHINKMLGMQIASFYADSSNKKIHLVSVTMKTENPKSTEITAIFTARKKSSGVRSSEA